MMPSQCVTGEEYQNELAKGKTESKFKFYDEKILAKDFTLMYKY